ncbi:MAG: response regulator, partial [Betaproteobacteria bacterium]
SEGVLAEHIGASEAANEALAAPEALGEFELAAPAPIDEQVLEQVDEALALAAAEDVPAPIAPAVELTEAEAYEPLADFRAAEAAIAHLGETELSDATTAEHDAGPVEAVPDAAETAAAAEPAAGALETVVAEAGLAPELVAAIARDEPESTVVDELDAELLEIFLVEGNEQLPAIGAALRVLAESPDDREAARDLMRRLHTVKGSARMAGAMRLGELVHAMETRIENAAQTGRVPQPIVEALHAQYDRAVALFDGLQAPAAAPESAAASAPATQPAIAPVIELPRAPGAPAAAVASFIRVRADVLDRLVDQAGEVAIARSKLENEVGTMRASLADLTDNIGRLRGQLREVSIQAEAQITARGDSLSRESDKFDPLEFDRFTRLQELTRLLTESVEDVALVHGNMLKGLQMAEQDLTSQSRLTRELQQQLMRVRLVPFSNVSERLYRVARQAAKELDKRVHLEIRGAATEIDRGVLERMAGPFEHLVRNAIVHGIESPAARARAGKAETGELRIDVRQEGNEIVVNFGDDGAGLPLERIRARAEARGLVAPGQVLSERELMELVFAPGFSTADEITELAGRGVGMDVVRSELSGFGGRVTVNTEPGRGTRFTLYLPLTLAVTQVVLATVGERRYAIPAAMVEQVRRMRPMVMEQALAEGVIDLPPAGQVVLRPLAQLADEPLAPLPHKPIPVVLVRSGDARLAIMVDEVSSNQEVVVKAVGAQVARLAGILGATILGSGEIVLILNPVQMITRAPEPAAIFEAKEPAVPSAAEPVVRGVPTVMVVDDSITVRRVTQRLLERQGWEVMLAKDGVDALRQLQDARPDVMLVDIETPRMDGFDRTRNLRGSRATANIPIIMITSRTADKHRSMAFDLGVNEYLGKPYQEDELVALIKRYTAERLPA